MRTGFPSFLRLNSIPCVYIYVPEILCSSVDRHVGCFCIFTAVNNAARDMGMKIPLQDTDFISLLLDIYAEVGFLDPMVVLF